MPPFCSAGKLAIRIERDNIASKENGYNSRLGSTVVCPFPPLDTTFTRINADLQCLWSERATTPLVVLTRSSSGKRPISRCQRSMNSPPAELCAWRKSKLARVIFKYRSRRLGEEWIPRIVRAYLLGPPTAPDSRDSRNVPIPTVSFSSNHPCFRPCDSWRAGTIRH
jgi:hypothetical protein